MNSIEKITHNERGLGILIHASLLPDQTTFITPSEYKQQVGFVIYTTWGEIAWQGLCIRSGLARTRDHVDRVKSPKKLT